MYDIIDHPYYIPRISVSEMFTGYILYNGSEVYTPPVLLYFINVINEPAVGQAGRRGVAVNSWTVATGPPKGYPSRTIPPGAMFSEITCQGTAAAGRQRDGDFFFFLVTRRRASYTRGENTQNGGNQKTFRVFNRQHIAFSHNGCIILTRIYCIHMNVYIYTYLLYIITPPP